MESVKVEWLYLAFWGLGGGFAIDGIEIWSAVRKARGKWPDEFCTAAFYVAEAIRLGIGAFLAVAFGLSFDNYQHPIIATSIGCAAPVVVGRLVKYATDNISPTPSSSQTEVVDSIEEQT